MFSLLTGLLFKRIQEEERKSNTYSNSLTSQLSYYYIEHYLSYTKYIYQRDFINMYNLKIITMEGRDTDNYLYIGVILRVCLLYYTIAHIHIYS